MSLEDKKLLKSIKRQLEFYFSEGNLPRDEFMQKCIKESKFNSISMEDMMKFNKLIELQATPELITQCVLKSKLLKFDDENKGIKRKIELEDLKPVNTRTIFICGFLNDENQKKNVDEVAKELKKLFKTFGKILRIDLPKYTTSNTLRGFGFIEFLTKTATRNALNKYKLSELSLRKSDSWKYFSFSNNQYSHALKQLEILGHPQKIFFENLLGEQRKEKTNTKITAIAKKEWLTFRKQFYDAQQAHLSEMKILISKYQTKQCTTNIYSHKQHEREKAETEICQKTENIATTSNAIDLSEQVISGSIVSFQCCDNNTKKSIKSILTELSALDSVAYVDFRDFNLSGYLRFKNAEQAIKFAENISSQISELRVLSSDEEQDYLNKIFQDKQTKKESQKRKNDRKRKHQEISTKTE